MGPYVSGIDRESEVRGDLADQVRAGGVLNIREGVGSNRPGLVLDAHASLVGRVVARVVGGVADRDRFIDRSVLGHDEVSADLSSGLSEPSLRCRQRARRVVTDDEIDRESAGVIVP
jgi:hypothetical protein